ncbi:hypothetical protein C8J57DRAFT_1644546, partial [Mycena rebaudengoi]
DDCPPFKREDWIGRGIKYSADSLPFEVIAAKNAVLQLPTLATDLIPPIDTPIAKFTEMKLPTESSALALGETHLWFSKELPTTNPSVLKDFTRNIPPAAVLSLLKRKLPQAWMDGIQSIVDPRFNDGADRLPLWTLTFWEEMAKVVKQQNIWKRSVAWLDREAAKCNLDDETKVSIEKARTVITTMGWKMPLTCLRGTTSTADLAEFLGTVWLRSDHIDMMMEDIAARVAADPELADKIVVAPLIFSENLENTKVKKYTKETASLLYLYERKIKDEGKSILYFPANVGESHWVAGNINFDKQTIGFGDSLPGMFRPPEKLIRGLKRWLQAQFGADFDCQYDSMKHGIQRDGVSCGIVLDNTVEVAIFRVSVWKQNRAVLARIKKFLCFAPYQLVEPAKLKVDGCETEDDGEEEEEEEGEGEGASEHQTDVSFATSSGMDIDEGYTASLVGPDDEMPAADLPPVAAEFPVAKKGATDTAKGAAKKQSSIFGFFKKSAAPARSSADVQKPTVPNNAKRPRAPSQAASETSSYSSKTIPPKKKPRVDPEAEPIVVGTSRAARIARAIMDAVRNGTFVVDEEKQAGWKEYIRSDDANAEFFEDNIRRVRHSVCGKKFLVKIPYDRSKPLKASAGTSTLPQLATKTGWKSNNTGSVSTKTHISNPADHKPCPGITEKDAVGVKKYLRRTGATGGGSRSVWKIATEKFKKAFSKLGNTRRQEVLDTQQHEQAWRNDHANWRVFSTKCKKTVPSHTSQSLPCSSCAALLSKKAFKVALKKPAPEPENYIYVNKQYRNQVLGELYARTIGLQDIIEAPDAKNTPCIRYAQGAMEGKYDNEVFSGLVEAMVTKLDREERGVGMQNFKYAPAYDEFCNMMRINSPAAYRAMQEHLPGRSERNFRTHEARKPRFPMDISERNFELLAEHLAALKYDGPVNLSCDDTKLFPSFRLYWDAEEKAHFLVGGTEGKLRVADPDGVKKVIAEARAEKATKIRLWAVTIPVPGVTPIILAALPIANDLKAEALLPLLVKVVNGLLDHNVKVISYACDGTQVERNVQDLFVKAADEQKTYVIKDPHGKGPDLRIVIAIVRGQAICMIQDSKHALKTFRNNLFSGAKLLPLGSYTAIYSRIRQMAFEDGSPLFHRDVEKLDRQDDNAATRLFSADTLKYLADHHPEYLGEIVYLFIFGELIDAYQNRSIPHAERIKLVLRARYFLNSWSSFLDLSGYNKSVYFLSREAVDIARIVIEGYLALIYIHRDYTDGVFPLLPWLHSSEACEHIFGESRRIVKDFTMLDFLYMIPKLRAKLHAAVVLAKSSQAKARASGYSHTYFDNAGINLLALSTFPSDIEITDIAIEAAEESDSLIALLGLAPSQLHSGANPVVPILPAIASWFDDSDVQDDDSVYGDTDEISMSEAQMLQDLIDKAEDSNIPRSKAENDQLLNLTCAALAVAADDMTKIHALPDALDEELIDEMVSKEYENIRAATFSVPPIAATEASKPLGRGVATAEDLNFDYLVELRRQHQTKQAARGVRTRTIGALESEKAKELSIRQQLIRKFHLALKEEQDVAVGTGLERGMRWRASAPGGRGADVPSAGNTANAAATASALAKNV